MPTQNGSSNGVNSHKDELDGVSGTSVQMIMLDEMANGHSEDGRDNPAFEGDHEHTNGNAKSPEKNGTKSNGTNGTNGATNGTKNGATNGATNGVNGTNGTNGTNGHHNHNHQPQQLSKDKDVESGLSVGTDTVEMVSMNPQNKMAKNGANNAKSNGKDGKQPLQMATNDYFRPVNNKRKLLRGEKLYVTSDQRANGRRWKWIAFWGGVFTFVAAALLTGILAATGIIMSKHSPSYGPANELFGNFSSNETSERLNGTFDAFTTTESSSFHTALEESQGTPTHILPEFSSPADDKSSIHTDQTNIITDDHRTPSMTPHTTTATPEVTHVATAQTVPFAIVPGVANHTETGDVVNGTDGRGRSLDEVVTMVPTESETLFPAIPNIPTEEEENNSTTGTHRSSESTVQPSLFEPLPHFNETDNATTEAESPKTNVSTPLTGETTSSSESRAPEARTSSAFESQTTEMSTVSLFNDSIFSNNPELFDEVGVNSTSEVPPTTDTDAVEAKSDSVNATTTTSELETNRTTGFEREINDTVDESSLASNVTSTSQQAETKAQTPTTSSSVAEHDASNATRAETVATMNPEDVLEARNATTETKTTVSASVNSTTIEDESSRRSETATTVSATAAPAVSDSPRPHSSTPSPIISDSSRPHSTSEPTVAEVSRAPTTAASPVSVPSDSSRSHSSPEPTVVDVLNASTTVVPAVSTEASRTRSSSEAPVSDTSKHPSMSSPTPTVETSLNNTESTLFPRLNFTAESEPTPLAKAATESSSAIEGLLTTSDGLSLNQTESNSTTTL